MAARPFDVELGARVRQARQAAGWSQERLAHAIGITQDAVSLYERGERSISLETLVAVARALDVPVSFFLDAHPDVVVVRGGLLHELGRHVQEAPEDTEKLWEVLGYLRWRRQQRPQP